MLIILHQNGKSLRLIAIMTCQTSVLDWIQISSIPSSSSSSVEIGKCCKRV